MNIDEQSLIAERLTKWIIGDPKYFFNVGVGPSKKGSNKEANVVSRIWPGINVIGFEPNIGLFLARSKDYPGTLFPLGIWNTPGPQTMMMTPNKGQSSILQVEKQFEKHLLSSESTKVVINCITLDCLDRALSNPRDIFLWMDIEGAELQALKGGSRLLGSGRVKWIILEVAHVPKRIDQPSGADIKDYLSQYGFQPKQKYDYSPSTHNVLYTHKKKNSKGE